jgi:RHS repeat-associated protein
MMMKNNDLSGTLQEAGGIGGLLARSEPSTLNPQLSTALYHADGNGNITALVTTNGTLAARYHYDPYGNILSMAGPLAEANLYRFSSKEWHQKSGLVYYLYRYYDPNLQRWVNRDPIGEPSALIRVSLGVFDLTSPPLYVPLNPFRFVNNEPTHAMDYLGLWTFGFRISVSLVVFNFNLSLQIDSTGNYENQCSSGFGFTAGVSITGGVTATTAESVQDLRGRTMTAGAAGGIPLGAQGEANAVWGDGYIGGDLGIGLGAGSPITPQAFVCDTKPVD